ncbi:MAG TPA: GlxA family transcriptional regulator [Candidatus Baltobacteraceae bacterium]|jgi:transcriptional regulator GlxA family with amidase domain|nr:GlxA family transcriptional regulator [Candidatus Baltobacteraceae bacterium]
MKTRRIGILAYDDVQALDVVGPADTFAAANEAVAGKVPSYEVVLLGVRKGRIRTESGLSLFADATLDERLLFDTAIVPGGRGVRVDPKVRGPISRWLRVNAGKVRRVASVCTGVYALAEAGLLDGRFAATHWRFASDVRDTWKKVSVDADAIFVKDGKYYTSAGITAGIDLCLSFVEEDCGQAVALKVARELVVYLKRSGGQMQYSQPLLLQTKAKEHFGDIAGWIRGHLADNLTIESIAERVDLSPRHFTRKFKDLFGVTPADFVEELRLDEARWLLVNAADSIAKVAENVGYSSDDTFRRAFERRFGVAPTEYRSRFA